MNKRELENYIRGSEYNVIESKLKNINVINRFKIIHRPSQAYVNIVNKKEFVEIEHGNTPEGFQGRGIGTELRALATIYAISKNKPIKQIGSNYKGKSAIRVVRKPWAKPEPTSTHILREFLGWNVNKNSSYKWPSIFRPGMNNTKVRAAANAARARRT